MLWYIFRVCAQIFRWFSGHFPGHSDQASAPAIPSKAWSTRPDGGLCMHKVSCGKNNAINHPFGNDKHTTLKNGDDWGMVYGIVLATLM